MNWTGGHLSRHSKSNIGKETTQQQKAHFAKARAKVQNGAATPSDFLSQQFPTVSHRRTAQPFASAHNLEIGTHHSDSENESSIKVVISDTNQSRSSNRNASIERCKCRLLEDSNWLGLAYPSPVQPVFEQHSYLEGPAKRRRLQQVSTPKTRAIQDRIRMSGVNPSWERLVDHNIMQMTVGSKTFPPRCRPTYYTSQSPMDHIDLRSSEESGMDDLPLDDTSLHNDEMRAQDISRGRSYNAPHYVHAIAEPLSHNITEEDAERANHCHANDTSSSASLIEDQAPLALPSLMSIAARPICSVGDFISSIGSSGSLPENSDAPPGTLLSGNVKSTVEDVVGREEASNVKMMRRGVADREYLSTDHMRLQNFLIDSPKIRENVLPRKGSSEQPSSDAFVMIPLPNGRSSHRTDHPASQHGYVTDCCNDSVALSGTPDRDDLSPRPGTTMSAAWREFVFGTYCYPTNRPRWYLANNHSRSRSLSHYGDVSVATVVRCVSCIADPTL